MVAFIRTSSFVGASRRVKINIVIVSLNAAYVRNLFPVSGFLSPFCPPSPIMVPPTLGALVSLIRHHIGHHFPELRKMVFHSTALGSIDACSHTRSQ